MAMVRNSSVFALAPTALLLICAGLLGLGSATTVHAQATPRVIGPVNESALVSLPGKVHPWARPEFDRGRAPDSMNGHMLMVLKRSPQQETALQSFLASQQDPKSPNYHQWLTPEEFGKRFGVADSDVQSVTGYLSQKGMRVGRVYGNHMAVEVEATAGQIRSAFQTEIHAYSIAGKTYYANNATPKIPSALSSVIRGFASLNSFHAEGGSGAGRQGTLDPRTHTVKPLFTNTSTTPTTYGVSPGDLAVIYQIPPSNAQGLGGANVNVGIVGDSDINVQYINNYRSTFGLPAKTTTVIVDGNDPGANDDAYIAYKQIELVSAVAPQANIYYYTSATTNYDSGIYFALIRAVEDNQVQVLLNGFQECETAIGDGAMELVNAVSEEAAALGMTFVAAAGNTGSAGCAVPGTAGALANPVLAVNGFASSPFVTAVGGTDFLYGTTTKTQPSAYWSNTNTGYTSALSYIPEQVWNDSNPNSSDSTVPNANPNNGPITSVQLAGGGGVSTAGLDGISTPQPMPSYQSSNANASTLGKGTARVIPDVSFFAGSGSNNSEGYNRTAYLFCMKYTDCQSTGTVEFTYSGGTEASSAVFAGAVALAVAQYPNGSTTKVLNGGARFGLGNINPALYSELGVTIPSHDINTGNNELACTGTGPCNFHSGAMTSYPAQTGYDAASGLGSFNITSFVSNFTPPNTTASSVTLTVLDASTGKPPVCGTTPNCTVHSTFLKLNVSAARASGSGATPTGDVGIFTSSPLQAQAAVESLTLSSGTASDTWNLLPGGTYNLYARYAGDATYAASVSAPYTITVKPEGCQMEVYGNNINITSPTKNTNTSIPYGSPVIVTVEPYSASSTLNVAIPSGSIQVTDNSKWITSLPFDSQGATTFSSNLLAFGSHSLVLTFPGDASFNSCLAGPYLVNITRAATTTTLNAPETDTGSSKGAGVGGTNTLGITAVVQSATLPSNGVAPTGTVTFSTVTPKTANLVPGYDPNGNAVATASLVIGQSDIPASGNISATYSPSTTDMNYLGSTSNQVGFTATNAQTNTSTTTTFTITDNYGTFPGGTNTFPNSSTPSFPVLDSITLNMKVKANNCTASVFLVYANGVLLTPATWQNGFLVTGGIKPSTNCTATFTIPQQNGYLDLPSGQVLFTVLYDGWIDEPFQQQQSDPSSANQIVTIVDDRTSADFSLQTDTPVNQANPLLESTSTFQANFTLRFTSIYNFQTAYATTPINLSCSIVGYSLNGVRTTPPPAGLTCGFGSLSTSTASVTLGGSGFASQTLVVGAANGFTISSNTTPAQPANRWWMAGGGTALACIFLLGLPARRRKWQSLLGACVLAIAGLGMTGCGVSAASGPYQQGYNSLNGGGNSPNGQTSPATPVPAGTYTVLVTATTTTTTTLTHTLPVQVLVGTTN